MTNEDIEKEVQSFTLIELIGSVVGLVRALEEHQGDPPDEVAKFLNRAGELAEEYEKSKKGA